MNLHDNIVATLRGQRLTLAELHAAMNAQTCHPWSEQFFKERIAQLLLHRTVVLDAEGRLSVTEP